MSSLGDLPFAYPLLAELKTTAATGKTVTIPVHTIVAGVPKVVPDYQLVIHFNGTVFHFTKPSQTPRGSATLTFEKIGHLALILDLFARAPTTYTTIKDTPAFSALYLSGPHDILYVNGPHSEESIACQACGIILPNRYMQMDHQRPQVGGEIESVVKSLRLLGLTAGKPHGSKCTQLSPLVAVIASQKDEAYTANAYMSTQWNQLKAVTPKSLRAPSTSSPAQQQARRDRYTLNEGGEILYSLVKHFKLEDKILRQSMHTLANLRPLCGPCNGARGNGDLKVSKTLVPEWGWEV